MAFLFYKKINGTRYYYIGQNKWDKTKKRSVRAWEISVGTADKLKENLEKGLVPKEVESVSFGISAAALNINNELDFVNTVDKFCIKREQGLTVGEHILIDIINRIEEPRSHNRLGDWFSKTVLKRIYKVKPGYLSSQGYWNHWQYIDEEKIDSIQKTILPKLIKDVDINQLIYDPTNFSTYNSDNHEKNSTELAKFGKPKSGLKGLRQINLALLVTRNYGIPLWHSLYEGNINDVTYFKTFVKSLMSRIEIFSKNCKGILLVFDKGNNSKTNIKRIDKDLHFFMLGSLTPSYHKELLNIPVTKYDYKYVNAKKNVIKAYSTKKKVFGKMMKIVLTYNDKTAYKQKQRTKRALDKGLAYLKYAQKRLNSPKWNDLQNVLLRIDRQISRFHANSLIDWNLTRNDHNKSLCLEFTKNTERLNYLDSFYGKSILFTDKHSLKPDEIINIYNDKYIVEHAIKKLKNKHIISFTPCFKWTDHSHRVHAFTCVMALLFSSLMRKKAHSHKLKLSHNKLIESLKTIRKVIMLMPKTNKVNSKIEKMDRLQKKLFDIFEMGKFNV